MPAESIILLAFSVLFAIIGFLIVDKLGTIDKSLSKLSQKLEDQSEVLSTHDTRITVLETEHKFQHG
jgi:hypothetical protein